MKPLRIAVLLSGSGTTMQNLIDLSKDGKLPIEIVLAVSDRPNIKGLEKQNSQASLLKLSGATSVSAFRNLVSAFLGGAGSSKPTSLLWVAFFALYRSPMIFKTKS